MEAYTLIAFLGSSILLTLTPGPDLLFVMHQSLTRGWRSGFGVALGLCSGLVIHTFLVAWGLGSVLEQNPHFFWGIKVFGALYFLILAIKIWNNRHDKTPLKEPLNGGWGKGLIMNLSNPKVLLFFLGFMPQFLFYPRWSTPVQLSVLGVLFVGQALVVFFIVAQLSDRFRKRVTTPFNRPGLQTGLYGAFVLWILFS
ncbi:MAG: LysE family translocator [Flavobacteriaceae bacterium]